MEQLLKIEQVADILQLNVKTVYDYAASGEIPSKKIGKFRRFDRQELEQWLRKNRG